MKLLSTILVILMLSQVSLVSAQDGRYTQLRTSDDLITLAFPSDWVAEGDAEWVGAILLLSDESILDKEPAEPMDTGEVSVLLSFLDSDTAAESGLVGDTPDEVLSVVRDALIERYTAEDGTVRVIADEIEVIEATDIHSEMALFSYTFDGSNGVLMFWNVTDGLLGTALIVTADGEWEDIAPTITDIVQSVRYIGPPELLGGEAE